MHVALSPRVARVERPPFVWIAIALEIVTAVGAIPVGLLFLSDPSGGSMRLPSEWIAATPFGTYFVPGLYLFFVNGLGMLALAAISIRRHWLAPWLTGALGVGLIIWIVVEIIALPETMWLTWVFLATGFGLGFVALFWLRRTDQLRLW